MRAARLDGIRGGDPIRIVNMYVFRRQNAVFDGPHKSFAQRVAATDGPALLRASASTAAGLARISIAAHATEPARHGLRGWKKPERGDGVDRQQQQSHCANRHAVSCHPSHTRMLGERRSVFKPRWLLLREYTRVIVRRSRWRTSDFAKVTRTGEQSEKTRRDTQRLHAFRRRDVRRDLEQPREA